MNMSVPVPLHDRDFYAWCLQQAAFLRAGETGKADLAHIAQEIETMGNSEKRELVNRLRVLLLHLLKWEFQPKKRGASWETSILVQRHEIAVHLRDNPSLKSRLQESIDDAYYAARLEAAKETRLVRTTFPDACPYSSGQLMDEGFWPGQAYESQTSGKS